MPNCKNPPTNCLPRDLSLLKVSVFWVNRLRLLLSFAGYPLVNACGKPSMNKMIIHEKTMSFSTGVPWFSQGKKHRASLPCRDRNRFFVPGGGSPHLFDGRHAPGALCGHRRALQPRCRGEKSYGYGNNTIWLCNIAMENGPFIDGGPIKNGDFPWQTVK